MEAVRRYHPERVYRFDVSVPLCNPGLLGQSGDNDALYREQFSRIPFARVLLAVFEQL